MPMIEKHIAKSDGCGGVDAFASNRMPSIAAQASFETSLLHLLHRAVQGANEIFAAGKESSSLTPRQYIVLAALAEHEGVSQTDIVARSGIDRSTLADIMRRLLKQGLLQRRRSKRDSRAYVVTLTVSGRSAFAQANVRARAVDQQLLGLVAPRARGELVRALQAMSRGSAQTGPRE